MNHARHIPLDGIFNLRDLGGYATPTGQTAWGRAYRADSLHRLDPVQISRLREMGVALIVDLRRAEECASMPNPVARGMEGLDYVNISLFEGLDPTHPRIVQGEDKLLALYCAALAERTDRFISVLRHLAAVDQGAVLFHCTAGKDRTGLVAAFLLLLAGVDEGDVVADYALTGDHMAGIVAGLEQAASEQGRDIAAYRPYLLSEPATMRAFLAHLGEAYGGAEAYLLDHGLEAREIARLRQLMSASPARQGDA